ncbi:SdrD B-like domain-containing protein [Lacinutrix himadriensis]|uniref:SdrD B-like domain-containing protein n=1 Tax=Lacinutrix himadriensis TaxID=641549 RepID=UPI0006E2D88B|nr:SdrD B-like domain-containing protein [Lacinutrix himadriensis]
MKNFTRFSICLIKLKDLFFIFFLLIGILNANAQSNPVFPNTQTLIAGTANQPGAVYLIEDVELTGNGGAFDVDAILSIVSFTGTPAITSVDDTQYVQNRFEPVITYSIAGQAIRWRMEFIVANSADSDLADAVSFPLDSYTLEIIDLDAEEWAEVIVPDSYELAGTSQPQTIITAGPGVIPNSIRFTSANVTDSGVSTTNTRSVVKVNYKNVSVVDFTLGRDNNDPNTTRNISVGFLGEVVFTTPNVVDVNAPPVVVDDLGNTINSDSSFFSEVLTGSSDPDGNIDPATVHLIDPNDFSNQGSVGTPLIIAGVGRYTVDTTGNVVFTPELDYAGDASILFTVEDELGVFSNQGNLEITVIDKCDALASGNLDSDGDDVSDSCDLDNDNDGIIDTAEGICTSPVQSESWNIVSTTEATFDYNNGVIARLVTNSTGFQTNSVGNFNTEAFWSETLSGDVSLQREYSWGSTLTVSFEDAAGNPIKVTNPKLHVDRLGGSDGVTENSALMTLQGGLTWTKIAGSGTTDLEVTSTTVRDSGSGNSIGTGYTFESTQDVANGTAAGSLQINGNMSTFTIQFVQDGVSGVLSDGIEFILFACTDLDTDGDGTPDYLDLDSDDDGCSDALEGTGIIDAGSVVNGQLTGAVDTVTGVPSNVDENLGQGVGGSIDGTPSDSNGQCDSDNDGTIDANDLCEGFDDNMNADGDAYPDGCDEDDDNDGITDVNEGLVIAPGQPDCGTETTLNFNNAYTEESGDGNVATLLEGEVFRFANVTTGVDALVTIVDFNNITSLPTLDDNGSNPNSFQPQSAFSLTSEGDQAWTEFQFDFVASGTTTPVVISKFFANFNDVDGGANYGEQNWSQLSLNYVVDSPTELSITNAGSWIVGTAGNNEYPGVTNTFPQVNYSTEHGGISSYFIRLGAIARVNGATANGRQHNVQFACVNNFVNPISTISIDTDGDGIPNHLDTDSDADGCPDAIEGNGGILLSQLDGNDMISGAINTNGIPTAANSGNGQADVSATDDMVNGCFGDITGVVFEDLNGNGTQDTGELGIEGVEVDITDVNNVTTTETTGPDGSWTASDIPLGETDINVDETTLPADITDTLTTTNSDPETITVVTGANTTTDDGYAPVVGGLTELYSKTLRKRNTRNW